MGDSAWLTTTIMGRWRSLPAAVERPAPRVAQLIVVASAAVIGTELCARGRSGGGGTGPEPYAAAVGTTRGRCVLGGVSVSRGEACRR